MGSLFTPGLDLPRDDVLRELHRRMVLGRRFDTQATALTKQGRLAVYPSSRGQDACQVGAVARAARPGLAVPHLPRLGRRAHPRRDPREALTLLRGDWHCGYDPYEHRVAPQCTPLATNTLHAVGLAHAARLKGEDTVALVLLGDGATSEGDTHEALNFAAVWKAPVVFLVQNNGYAISVPLAKQTAAPTLAAQGDRLRHPRRADRRQRRRRGVRGRPRRRSSGRAAGGGPTLIEALTYRIEAHTNADDADPLPAPAPRCSAWLAPRPDRAARGVPAPAGDCWTTPPLSALAAEAEALAGDLRQRMNADVGPRPGRAVRARLRRADRRACASEQQLLAAELEELADEPAMTR